MKSVYRRGFVMLVAGMTAVMSQGGVQEAGPGLRPGRVERGDRGLLDVEVLASKLKGMREGPRLLLTAAGEVELRERIKRDALLGGLSERMILQADQVLSLPLLERRQTGRRLLDVSRDALGRMLLLGYAFRMTGEAKYAEKARAEMAAICRFSDFNPDHFLDVGEMTAALGIGLDWFGGVMSEEEKAAVRKAIIEKGIGPSFDRDHFWMDAKNNWNQVCHGGLTVGALAVADVEPALAARVISRAIENLPIAMREYGPDGAYPEGPGYWEYGTTYNVLMLSVLESALGDDFGLATVPGFMESSRYFLHATGPSGNWFNYSDCGSRSALMVSAAAFWFAAKLGDVSLVYNEVEPLGRANARMHVPGNRWTGAFGVMMLCWAGADLERREPVELRYIGSGKTPVAFFRTGWNEQATWVGVKAGSPSAPHGQMDIGQFVIDAMGVRWVEDLGMQEYNSLESLGLKIWNLKQDSDRWGVYRMGAESHGILTVLDGGGGVQPLAVEGRGDFTKKGEDFVVMDTTAIYGGKVERAGRGVKLVAGEKAVRIRDEVTTKGDARIRWAFATRAEVSVIENTLLLQRDGKQMLVRASRPSGGGLEVVWEVGEATGKQEYDAPNPGVRMVWMEMDAKAGLEEAIEVEFVPKGAAGALVDSTMRGRPQRLSEW